MSDRDPGGNLIIRGGNLHYVASLVPVGNRIYHQGGAECRTHGSCFVVLSQSRVFEGICKVAVSLKASCTGWNPFYG